MVASATNKETNDDKRQLHELIYNDPKPEEAREKEASPAPDSDVTKTDVEAQAEQEGFEAALRGEHPSAIRWINQEFPVRARRLGRLMVALPLSSQASKVATRQLIDFRVYVEVSAFLAFKHLQSRSGSVLPQLPSLLEDCDFTWTYEHHDTQFSPLHAAKAFSKEFGMGRQEQPKKQQQQYSNASISSSPNNAEDNGNESLNPTNDDGKNTTEITISPFDLEDELLLDHEFSKSTRSPNASQILFDESENDKTPENRKNRRLDTLGQDEQQLPFALMGAARSVVSKTLSILSSVLDLPQISSSSTAKDLDDDTRFFSRTVPTNNGDAHAMIAYLHRLRVSHIAVLFIKDNWGREYELALRLYGQRYNITVSSVAYTDEGDLGGAMAQLQSSGMRYIVGIINPDSWRRVLRTAYQYGIIGNPRYQWFFGDLIEVVGEFFVLDATAEWDLAQALHGTGLVFLKVSPHPAFDRAIAAFADNSVWQQEYIDAHTEPYLFDNFIFEAVPGRSLFQYLTYDAVMTLGLTACNTPGLFTGGDFYEQLLEVDFEGVSGRVKLNGTTGTRLEEGLDYQIINVVLREQGKDGYISFEARESITVNLSPALSNDSSVGGLPLIYVNEEFIYYSNTTSPPLVLPSLEENMNLIPDGLRGFGLALGILAMLMSVACAIWTYVYRNGYVVRASQPIFLFQVCVGTFILAATVIPLSFQENMPGLDAACKALPFCVCIGFTVAMSALFSKAHRINKLMNSGTSFRRIQIKPANVIRPFLILITINIALLTAWTVSPYSLRWERKSLNNYDEYGRSVESYGMCRSDGGFMFLIFLVPLTVANLSLLAIATFESYKGRNLPSEFSETTSLSISLISLSETCILGATTMIAVLNQPTAFFLTASLVLFLACLSILLPVFLPKYFQRHAKEPGRRAASQLMQLHRGSVHASSQFASGLEVGIQDVSSNRNFGGNAIPRGQVVTGENPATGSDTSQPSLLLHKAMNSSFFASSPQPIRRIGDGRSSGGSFHNVSAPFSLSVMNAPSGGGGGGHRRNKSLESPVFSSAKSKLQQPETPGSSSQAFHASVIGGADGPLPTLTEVHSHDEHCDNLRR